MKLLILLCAVQLCLSLKDGTYFQGCQMRSSLGATGWVACMLGPTGTNSSLVCTFEYSGLTANLVAADVTLTATTLAGSPSFGKLIDFTNSIAFATDPRDGNFDAVILETVKYQASPLINSVTEPFGAYNSSWGDFTNNLARCFDHSENCLVTLRTDNGAGGTNPELACTLAEMIYGGSWEFALEVNKSVSASQASGYAWLNWYVSSTDTYQATSVWAYAVDFTDMTAAVNQAGLFNAMSGFPALTSNPASVAFDTRGAYRFQQTTGSLIGVAIQGTVGDGSVTDNGGYNLDASNNWQFLTNCSVSNCYVGVGTVAIPGFMELRGQLVAGVGQLVPSLLVVLVFLGVLTAL